MSFTGQKTQPTVSNTEGRSAENVRSSNVRNSNFDTPLIARSYNGPPRFDAAAEAGVRDASRN